MSAACHEHLNGGPRRIAAEYQLDLTMVQTEGNSVCSVLGRQLDQAMPDVRLDRATRYLECRGDHRPLD